MMGLHPTSVDKDYASELKKIKEYLDNDQYIAIGEIGIDLYWDKTHQAEQEEAFRTQIGWAIERELPIVIHARDSFKEIFEVVDDMNCEKLRGVFHCFTGTAEDARKIIDYGGFKMGIGGVLTFKNSKLDEVVKDISLEHLILETDSPYLAPAPHRGKRNESSYVSLVTQKLAETKGLPLKDIASATTQNAVELFNLDLK
jgi:TatD DNase family protein